MTPTEMMPAVVAHQLLDDLELDVRRLADEAPLVALRIVDEEGDLTDAEFDQLAEEVDRIYRAVKDQVAAQVERSHQNLNKITIK